jgi:hypothetical protein
MTLTSDGRDLLPEWAPHMDGTETSKPEISGHEHQTGLDTEIDRLTNHQSQCDFDLDYARIKRTPATGGPSTAADSTNNRQCSSGHSLAATSTG